MNIKKKKACYVGYPLVNSHSKKEKKNKKSNDECNTKVLIFYNIQLYDMMNSFIKIEKYWIILKNTKFLQKEIRIYFIL